MKNSTYAQNSPYKVATTVAALGALLLAPAARASYDQGISAHADALYYWQLSESQFAHPNAAEPIQGQVGYYIKEGRFKFQNPGADPSDRTNFSIEMDNCRNNGDPTGDAPGVIEVPHAAGFEQDNGSLSFFVKRGNVVAGPAGRNRTIVSKDASGHPNGMGSFEISLVPSTGELRVDMEMPNGDIESLRSTNNKSNLDDDESETENDADPFFLTDRNAFYHVVFAWRASGARKGMWLYIDGDEVDFVKDARFSLAANGEPMVIGASQRNSPSGKQANPGSELHEDGFCGGLDDFVFFGDTLAPTDIDDLLITMTSSQPRRHIALTVNNSGVAAGIQFFPGDLVDYDQQTPQLSGAYPGAIPGSRGRGIPCADQCKIMGSHIRDDNGNVLLTFRDREDIGAGPLRVEKQEIVEYNPNSTPTTSIWGDPIAPGHAAKVLTRSDWPNGVGFPPDALSVHPKRGTLLLSIAQNGKTFGSNALPFDDAQIVEWNNTGSDLTFNDYDGTSVTLPQGDARIFFNGEQSGGFARRNEDIDAFHVFHNGNVAMSMTSASSSSVLGRRYFGRGEVIEFNPSPTKTVFGLGPQEARKILSERVAFNRVENIRALSIPPYHETFSIRHNQIGVNCFPEDLEIQPLLSNGDGFTPYGGSTIIEAVYPNGYTGPKKIVWHGPDGVCPINGVDEPCFEDLEDGRARYRWQGEAMATVKMEYKRGDDDVRVVVYDEGNPTIEGQSTDIRFYPRGFRTELVDTVFPEGTTGNFATAGSPFDLNLTAFGLGETGECGVIEDYVGTKNLNMWMAYEDPSIGSREMTFTGMLSPVPAMQAADITAMLAAGQTTVAHPVAFTAGQATIRGLKYKDVGQVRFYVYDDQDEETGQSLRDPGFEWGSDSPSPGTDHGPYGDHLFVVRPHHFDVAIDTIHLTGSAPDTNPKGTDATAGPVFERAGSSLRVEVTALDADDDPTPNFGFETNDALAPSPEDILFEAIVVSPLESNGGQHGSFGLFSEGCSADPASERNLDFADLDVTDAVASGDFCWSEVGSLNVKVDVRDGDYLGTGAGAAVVDPQGPIGRFIPAQFAVLNPRADTPGSAPFDYDNSPTATFVKPACVNVEEDGNGLVTDIRSFTYGKQPFSGQVRLEAQNVHGARTSNYFGDFAKLDPASEVTALNSLENDAPFNGLMTTQFLSGEDFDAAPHGVATVKLDLRWDSADPQLEATSHVQIQVSEDELSAFTADQMDGPARFTDIGSTLVRWGRLRIPNAYGSELEPLDVPMLVEHYADIGGGSWVVNGFEDGSCSCLGIDAAKDNGTEAAFKLDLVAVRESDRANESPEARTHSAVSEIFGLNEDDGLVTPAGQALLRFLPPFDGTDYHPGTFRQPYKLETMCGVPPTWLQFNWDGSGIDTNPVAQITFGIHKASRRRVFVREVY